MGGVVDRGVVEQDEVLVRAAAAHVQAAHPLGTRLHPGQQLQGLEHVDLPHEGGGALDLPDRHLHDAHPRLLLDRVEPLGFGLHRLHFQGRRLEGDVELQVAAEVGGEGVAAIADVGDHHPERTGRQGEAEEAEAVGRRALLQVRLVQDRPDQLLAAGGVLDVAAEGVLGGSLRPGAAGEAEKEDQDEDREWGGHWNERFR